MDTLSLISNAIVSTGPARVKVDKLPINAAQPDGSMSSAPTDDANLASNEFSKNVGQFKSLTATLIDKSGKYSYDEQLKAYSSLHEMAVKGKLSGMMTEDEKLFSKAISESDVGTRDAEIRQQAFDDRLAAQARGESTAVSYLKFLSKLSDNDQKTVFTTQNGFDMAGNRQYADFDSYRNQLVANAAHEYEWAAGRDQSQPQQSVANKIEGDPKGIAQALRNLSSATLGDAWGAHILSLIGSDKGASSDWDPEDPKTGLSLSVKLPPSYSPGNIFNRIA